MRKIRCEIELCIRNILEEKHVNFLPDNQDEQIKKLSTWNKHIVTAWLNYVRGLVKYLLQEKVKEYKMPLTVTTNLELMPAFVSTYVQWTMEKK